MAVLLMDRCMEASTKILSASHYTSRMNMQIFKVTSPSIMMTTAITVPTNLQWMGLRRSSIYSPQKNQRQAVETNLLTVTAASFAGTLQKNKSLLFSPALNLQMEETLLL